MESDQRLPTSAEWLAAIVQKSGQPEAAVSATLKRHGITPKPMLPRTRHVSVRSILMEGVKHGASKGERFRFEWAGLEQGFWALISGENNKGKSSVLNVIRGALQGNFPGRLKPDIWKWLDHIEVEFAIDEVSYGVIVKKSAGEEAEKNADAVLERRQGPSVTTLYSGVAGDGLQDALGDLFMAELGFDTFYAYRKGDESRAEHGWPVMSSALFISGDAKAIFGDYVTDGLPVRLMQLFIGLPWISTFTAAAAAAKQIKMDGRERGSEYAQFESRISSRIETLRVQIATDRKVVEGTNDLTELRSRLLALDDALLSAQAEISKARIEREEAVSASREAGSAHVESRRLLQQARDEAAAGQVFRKLKPACCPACEAGFDPDRFEAAVVEVCGLCGNSDVCAPEDDADRIAILTQEVKDAEETWLKTRSALTAQDKHLAAAEARRAMTIAEIAHLQAALAAAHEAQALEMRIKSAEATVQELERVLDEGRKQSPLQESEKLILEAAEKVTKGFMEALQEEVLDDVSKQLFKLSKRFGIMNLERMRILPGGRLEILQGGAMTNFSRLSPGENLRVRVAAALAVLKVSQDRGFGRHPGIIVIDSPGAQEIAKDMKPLLEGMVSAVSEIPYVQMIVASRVREELTEVVPSERRREARGDETLF